MVDFHKKFTRSPVFRGRGFAFRGRGRGYGNNAKINHLDTQELRNLLLQLTSKSQVPVPKCDGNMFNNTSRRQENYPYNACNFGRGLWSRHDESTNRRIEYSNHNNITSTEYSAKYDGQNYDPGERNNRFRENVDKNAYNFPSSTKFRSQKYRKRGTYHGSNVNNYYYDNYYQKSNMRYEESNIHMDGFHKYPIHKDVRVFTGTSDSARRKTYNTRDSSSNFRSEPSSYKNDIHNWDCNYENVDMDINDSECEGGSRSQKRKSERYDDNIPNKKSCGEQNGKANNTLKLIHRDSSDFTDDDCVGIKQKDVRRNSVSSSGKESPPYTTSSAVEKSCSDLLLKKATGISLKKKIKNAERRRSTTKEQHPVSTATSCDNVSEPVTITSVNEKNLILVQTLTQQQIELNRCSSQNTSNIESARFPKHKEQRKIDNESSPSSSEKVISNTSKKESVFVNDKEKIARSRTPLKIGGFRKSQEYLKQCQNVTRSSNDVPKQHKNIDESCSETKKLEKLPTSSSVKAQSSKTQSKDKLNCIDKKSVRKERDFNTEWISKTNQQEHSKEKKLNCDDPKKSLRKERAFSFDGSSSQVSDKNEEQKTSSKYKKLKVSKSSESEQVKVKERTEMKLNCLDQDNILITDDVLTNILTDLENRAYVAVNDKVTKKKDGNNLLSIPSKQTPVHTDDQKTIKNKDDNKSASTSSKQTSSVGRKSTKHDKTAKKKEDVILKLPKKHSQIDKTEKNKDETHIAAKQIPSTDNTKNVNKVTKNKENKHSNNKPRKSTHSNNRQSKHVTEKVKKHKVESENSKLKKLSKNNASDDIKSISNPKDREKTCHNNFSMEKTTPLKEFNTKAREFGQKSPNRNSNSAQSILKSNEGIEDVVKPAKRIIQRRGKSCDSRCFNQENYLDTLNLKPVTRSKSVDPSEFFTPFRITRSKSAVYGLSSGLPPPRRRSRSRSLSAAPEVLDEDKSENDAQDENNSDRSLKPADDVSVYKPHLIDMVNENCRVAYTPRDDDDEVAMHMTNCVTSSYVRPIDPRDPRKNQLAQNRTVYNRKEFIKLKDFLRIRFIAEKRVFDEQMRVMQNSLETAKPIEQTFKPNVKEKGKEFNDSRSPNDKFVKRRKPPDANTSSLKGENKKCVPNNLPQINKPAGYDMPQLDCENTPQSETTVNVQLKDIEAYFPSLEENRNCIRLNVSNGTEERDITILRADISQFNFVAEETTSLTTDPLVSTTAQICNTPNPMHEAIITESKTYEANQNAMVIDLTMDDDSCEEQSDLTSINDINKLTEQLLEMYGDEMKPSDIKTESLNSPSCLLNILQSPMRQEINDTTNEANEAATNNNTDPTIDNKAEPTKNNNTESPSILLEALQSTQPNEEHNDIPVIITTGINLHSTPEVETVNHVTPQTSEKILANFETAQTAPKSQAKNADLNQLQITSPESNTQSAIQDVANLNASITLLGLLSKHNQNILSRLETNPAKNANECIPTPTNVLTIESRQGYLPANNTRNSVLPNMGDNNSASSIILSQGINQRGLSNQSIAQAGTINQRRLSNQTNLSEQHQSLEHAGSINQRRLSNQTNLSEQQQSLEHAGTINQRRLSNHTNLSEQQQSLEHAGSINQRRLPNQTNLSEQQQSLEHAGTTNQRRLSNQTNLSEQQQSLEHAGTTNQRRLSNQTNLSEQQQSLEHAGTINQRRLSNQTNLSEQQQSLEHAGTINQKRLSNQTNLSEQHQSVDHPGTLINQRSSNQIIFPHLQTSLIHADATNSSKVPPNSSVNQQVRPSVNSNLPITHLQHMVEKSSHAINLRECANNLREPINQEVPLNRVAPCYPYQMNSNAENNSSYRNFVSRNVYYILRYQYTSELLYRLFPSYIKHLPETSTKKITSTIMQNFFENILSDIEREARMYYNSIQTVDMKFSQFFVNLDSELTRNGPKMFWKWRLEFLYKLLCRNTSRTSALNPSHKKFLTDLKMYYNEYVLKNKRTMQNSENVESNLTDKVVRSANISVVPLATLQDPALCNPNLSTSNSNVQRKDTDKQQHAQSTKRSNNVVIQSVSSTFNQTVANQMVGMTPQQLQVFLQQIETCKKMGLLKKNTGRSHRRPSQEHLNVLPNLDPLLGQNCNQLEYDRQQRLLTGQIIPNDYSQNLRISNIHSGGSVRNQGSTIQHRPLLSYPFHPVSQFQHNKAAQSQVGINDQRVSINNSDVSPQQQQRRQENRANLLLQNDASHRSEAIPNNSDLLYSRLMTNMTRNKSLRNGAHLQPQLNKTRSEVDQNNVAQQCFTFVQNLSARDLSIANTHTRSEVDQNNAAQQCSISVQNLRPCDLSISNTHTRSEVDQNNAAQQCSISVQNLRPRDLSIANTRTRSEVDQNNAAQQCSISVQNLRPRDLSIANTHTRSEVDQNNAAQQCSASVQNLRPRDLSITNTYTRSEVDQNNAAQQCSILVQNLRARDLSISNTHTRSEADQNNATQQCSTFIQNLSACDLSIANTQNIPRAPVQEQMTQDVTLVTTQQIICATLEKQLQQLSSNASNSNHAPNRFTSMPEQITSVTNNEVQQQSVTRAITQTEEVQVEGQEQTSDLKRSTPSITVPKQENTTTDEELIVNEEQIDLGAEEFVDFENYLTSTHGENWDDDIEIFWPENYVVLPFSEEVKEEINIQSEVVLEEDPIPRSVSNDSGIESPTDIVLPSQILFSSSKLYRQTWSKSETVLDQSYARFNCQAHYMKVVFAFVESMQFMCVHVNYRCIVLKFVKYLIGRGMVLHMNIDECFNIMYISIISYKLRL